MPRDAFCHDNLGSPCFPCHHGTMVGNLWGLGSGVMGYDASPKIEIVCAGRGRWQNALGRPRIKWLNMDWCKPSTVSAMSMINNKVLGAQGYKSERCDEA